MDWLSELNPPQREAVTYGDGPLLILAGAGSGKTRALTCRIAHLIEARGVRPWNVLAITFTNKAAGEMKGRVTALLPDLRDDVWVATFHSTCARILRREAALVDRRPDFAIYDAADQRNVVRHVLRDLGWDQQKFTPGSFMQAIGAAKNELLGPDEYQARATAERGDFWAARTARVYRAYQAELEHNNALDFDDLIGKAVELFETNPEALSRYQERFRYVLVDEYQDTNHAQYRLVRALASRYRNLSVVGDDDQSIYTFRGADPRNILEFERDYPDAHLVKLEQNYRSTATVLAAANSLVRHNDMRKPKRLWTENEDGEPIGFYQAEDQSGEADFVCRTLEGLRAQGTELGRSAVLYRTNAQSRPLEEALLHAGLPYQIVGGPRFYERKEVKDLLAYVRVVANPVDRVSLERVINVPRRGVGPATWERLVDLAARSGLPIAEALAEAGELPGLSAKTRRDVVELGTMFLEMRRAAETVGPAELLRAVAERSGYLAELRAEGTPEAAERLENVEELVRLAVEHAPGGEDGGLQGFLERVALMTDIDTFEEAKDRVTLMTVHTAKGLEFENVFIVGLDEGLFPHARSLGEERGLEEERRLCYVALTRAKRRLFLSCATRRAEYGGQVAVLTPSRFLSELPGELMRLIARPNGWFGDDRVRRASIGRLTVPVARPLVEWARGRAPAGPGAAVEACEEFRPGERVLHPKWGEGTVVSSTGAGRDAEVNVAFAGLGVKRLLAGYARLARVSTAEGAGSDGRAGQGGKR